MSVVILIGCKGSGKSTLAYSLAKCAAYEHVSFRMAANHAWPDASTRLTKGGYVSDSEAIKVISPYLPPVGTNLVLDGFPRTEAQLNYITDVYGDGISFVHLVLENKEGLQRLSFRELCVSCGMPYNAFGLRFTGSCFFCGMATVVRRPSDASDYFLSKQTDDYNTKTRAMVGQCRAMHTVLDLEYWVTDAREWIELGIRLSECLTSREAIG
jgi:adenylate kinase family enzyme